MALPKEPRQKMINMMYLVLTALLALNVSSEILNAFKVVNNSIATSNAAITDKNALTYKSFEDKLKDGQTRARAELWAPKAQEAQKLSTDLFNYLEGVKTKLKQESGLKKDKTGEEVFNEDNLDATTRLMDKQGEGKKMYDALKNYRAQMLAILDPAQFANDPLLQADVKKHRDDFERSLPVDLSIPPSKAGNKRTGNPTTDWVNNYFHMTPTIAGLTILSKFQSDVKNSESQIIDYCHTKIGEVIVVFNKFQAIAQANTTYAMPGDPIEITAGVGAFSEAAKPTITIDGKVQPLNADGVAQFKSTAGGAGKRTVDVVIEYTKPDGTKERVNKKVEYTVGMPSGASVFLEKMNVLYLDVANPLTISGGSVGREQVSVSFPAGTIKNVGGDRWEAMPKNPGMSKIIVTAKGKNYEFPMRVKMLPPPTGFVGTKKGGSMPSAEFKAMGGVIARLEDSEFEVGYKVESYTVSAVGGPVSIMGMENNNGNRWTGPAAGLINRCGPGTTVFFDNITVVGPGGRKRDIPPMKFTLR